MTHDYLSGLASTTSPSGLLALCFFLFFAAQAQPPLYNFTFDEDLDGWTTAGITSLVQDSAKNALWVHTPDGTAGTGAYNSGEQPILSLSGGGAALFDSDGLDNGGVVEAFGLGPAPAPQRSELASPVLDFSGEEEVWLVFYQYYRYFAKNRHIDPPDASTPNSFIAVSNGARDTVYAINENIGRNESTSPADVVALDISDFAAGQAAVQVKFIWQGEYYFWIIDDVRFFDQIGVDLAIQDFTTVSNFATPAFAMEGDATDFEVSIINNGSEDIFDSIEVIVQVFDPESRIIFADTGYVDTLLVGQPLIWDFEQNWTPENVIPNDIGFYFVAYEVRMKGDPSPERTKPYDNFAGQVFQISDGTFQKVLDGSNWGWRGGTTENNEDYACANYFKFSNKITERFAITNVFFEGLTTDDVLAGKTVTAYVIKLPDEVAEPEGTLLAEKPRLLNFDYAMSIDQMMAAGWVIGKGEYNFTADDDEFGGPFELGVFDIATGNDPVIIDPGSAVNAADGTAKYLIAVEHKGAANRIFHEVNTSYTLWQLSTLFYERSSGGWILIDFPGFPYQNNIAAIGFGAQILMTATHQPTLPDGMVTVFPNPASEFLTVDLNFEQATDATIVIADIDGNILTLDLHERIQSAQLRYNMTPYPAGTYLVRISTRQGVKTERVVVTH